MRLPCCRPTVRRVMASVAVFAACLAAIRGVYRAPFYGDTVAVKVLPVAERTPEGMAAHARRFVSPEVLRRASLDSRLSSLHRPLRAAAPDELIGSRPGPMVYASVFSVEDGILWIDSETEGSRAEATSIARAVADAYVADQGTSRVVPWTVGIPLSSMTYTSLLGEPWQLAAALALAVVASALVLVGPIGRLSLRRWMTVAVAVPTAAVLALELLEPFLLGSEVDVVVSVVVSGAFGVGAARRPWLFLAIALVVWAGAPVMHHGFNAVTLSAQGCLLAWMVGAPAGWVSRHVPIGGKRSPG